MKRFPITTGRDGSRTFGEHDDRWSSNPRGRGGGGNRHNFNSRNRGRGRGRGRGGGPWNRAGGPSGYVDLDQEGDVVMGGEQGQSGPRRYNPYGGKPRQGGRRDQYKKTNSRVGSQVDISTASRLGLPVSSGHAQGPGGRQWFKISIPYAKKVSKETLLATLVSHTAGNFRPLQFQYHGEMAVFYVDNKDMANLLKSISKSINIPGSNLKMVLNVVQSSPPVAVITDENIDKLKVVMSSRYDPSVKAIDLSALSEDKDLQSEGVFLPMNRSIVAHAVGKIIQENIPELVGINLSNNRLLSLASMEKVVSLAPNVTALNLSHNQLRDVDQLDYLKGWQLTELVLDDNPLCDKLSKTEFISAVRKRFPKIVKLDGVVLPPPITFAVSAAVIPPSQGSHFVNAEVQDLVVKFLKEYYTIYDSGNRQQLIDAYHDNALLSLAVATNPLAEYKQPFLGKYLESNRNFSRLRDKDDGDYSGSRAGSSARTKERLLKKGKLQVVTELCGLPKTTHDASSFIVDVNILTSTVLSFVVTGLFKESDKVDKPPVRCFSRCFVTVPAAGGVLIINDMLTITNATSEQQQAAFKNTGPTPSSSPVSSNPPSVLVTPPGRVVGAAVITPTVAALPASEAFSPQQQLASLPPARQQMVLQFCQHSGMNPLWSFRCLEENAWEYEKAGQVFLSLQQEGKIPPEAFVK